MYAACGAPAVELQRENVVGDPVGKQLAKRMRVAGGRTEHIV